MMLAIYLMNYSRLLIMVKSNPFGNIGKKAKPSTDDFINTAKVDGGNEPKKLDPQGRRGANYKDKDTGKMIKLGGKVLQVPLNEYELSILSDAALNEGLPLATFLRATALKYVKNT